jgi:hypothetical protein
MSSRAFRGLIVVVTVVVASEALLTVVAFASMVHRRGVPSDVVACRLLLARWLIAPFLPVNSLAAPYTGGRQRYLGDLSYDSSEWIELIKPDSLLGSRNGRNITALDEDSVYVTNDEGFASIGERDFHYGSAPSSGCARIIMIGGSTVFGWKAGTPDRSLPARLHHILGRRQGSCFQVINAGVPGYTSAQEVLYLMSELVYYNPDLVIVYDGWNDQAASAGDFGQSFIRPAAVDPIQDGVVNALKTPNPLYRRQIRSDIFHFRLGALDAGQRRRENGFANETHGVVLGAQRDHAAPVTSSQTRITSLRQDVGDEIPCESDDRH